MIVYARKMSLVVRIEVRCTSGIRKQVLDLGIVESFDLAGRARGSPHPTHDHPARSTSKWLHKPSYATRCPLLPQSISTIYLNPSHRSHHRIEFYLFTIEIRAQVSDRCVGPSQRTPRVSRSALSFLLAELPCIRHLQCPVVCQPRI
jgi:hypothetical protein